MLPNLNEIPAAACAFSGGHLAFGESPDDAKSSPIKMLARSSQPIEHWFWGRVVHDLSGMRITKNRQPVDYNHDPDQVIGYVNKRETDAEGLHLFGALVPWKDSDRASEVIFKNKQGVPYEASIFFGGDGIKAQIVEDGEVTDVNGYQFAGPGIVIREWPLRGVAITPYGADENTRSFSNAERFSATAYTHEPATEVAKEEVPEMAEEPNAATSAVEPDPVNVETTEPEAVEAVESSGAVVELAEPAPAQPAEEVPAPAEVPAVLLSELSALAEKFGADIAVKAITTGADPEKLQLAAKVASLEAELAAKAAGGTAPATFASGEAKPSGRAAILAMCQTGTKNK